MKTSEVSENLGGLEGGLGALSQQEMLVAGALRPAHLLDLLHNFTLFDRGGGRIKKIVPRYQQFRAVHKAVEQLQQGATKAEEVGCTISELVVSLVGRRMRTALWPNAALNDKTPGQKPGVCSVPKVGVEPTWA
ncbi:MAG: hypothetical protein ACLFU8_03420 [Anaerolineales bacterium]